MTSRTGMATPTTSWSPARMSSRPGRRFCSLWRWKALVPPTGGGGAPAVGEVVDMTPPADYAGPSLPDLASLFPPAGELPEYEFVPADEVPPPYHGLLVHEYHMTVTVEAYHGDLVDVRVLAVHRDQDSYARKILLALHE